MTANAGLTATNVLQSSSTSTARSVGLRSWRKHRKHGRITPMAFQKKPVIKLGTKDWEVMVPRPHTRHTRPYDDA